MRLANLHKVPLVEYDRGPTPQTMSRVEDNIVAVPPKCPKHEDDPGQEIPSMAPVVAYSTVPRRRDPHEGKKK
jgi:hypothetical protein